MSSTQIQSVSASAVAVDKMVFRKTDTQLGRTISVTPRNSTNKQLSYGRIRLNAQVSSVEFHNGHEETGFLCLSGEATVKVSRAAPPSALVLRPLWTSLNSRLRSTANIRCRLCATLTSRRIPG